MFSASKTAAPVSGVYQISNSLRFRSSASAYLSRTLGSTSNRKTFTYSFWVKRGTVGSSTGQVLFGISDNVTSSSFIYFNTVGVGSTDCFAFQDQGSGTQLTTTQVFRDPSAWYHFVVAVDTTQATSSNRVKLYVNGTQITSFSTSTYPSQNANTNFNYSSLLNTIGDYWTGSLYFLDGYLADINFIDGQALTPSSFGQINPTTGVWQPIKYAGTYGTNGFHLAFNNGTSTTTLGYDSSGNGNNWTTNNISLTAGSTYDWMLDSPTPFAGTSYGVGNYAVLNPINTNVPTISAGNLSVTGPDNTAMATIGMPSGKWYFETTVITVGPISAIGMCATQPTATNYPGYLSDGYCYILNGNKQNNNTLTAYGASYTNGDVIGVAFDADAGSLTFYKNGVSQGVAFSSIPAKTYYFAVYGRSAGGTNNCAANFGQRPFAYTPPTGYKALNTQNLPAPSIQNGANYMAATLYTGTGASLSVSNASFQPDLVWIKSRSAATDHALYDVIRGTQNRLESNTTDAAVAADNGITAFNSNGFTVNTLAQVNTNAATYVGWQWKAGGTAVTNTAGSITSSVSANTTAGFSVVTYTGNGTASTQTIGHGLGVTISIVIIKARVTGGNDNGWGVSHTSIAAPSFLYLNTTDAAGNLGPAQGQPSIGTGNTFKVLLGTTGTNNFNASGVTYVAYCFAAIPGYSAFGSYTGNGSADGPFVYCGFRPRFVLIKCSSTTGNWYIFDSARNTYNVLGEQLYPNLSNAGSTVTTLDILSNGFKMRISTDPNASATYVYAAFASSPFQNSLAF